MTQDFEVDNLKASGDGGESGKMKTKRSNEAIEDQQARKRQCRMEAYTKADTKAANYRQESFSDGAEQSSRDSSDSDSNSETGLESAPESKKEKWPSINNADLLASAVGNHYDHRKYNLKAASIKNKVINHFGAEHCPRDSETDSNSGTLG